MALTFPSHLSWRQSPVLLNDNSGLVSRSYGFPPLNPCNAALMQLGHLPECVPHIISNKLIKENILVTQKKLIKRITSSDLCMCAETSKLPTMLRYCLHEAIN